MRRWPKVGRLWMAGWVAVLLLTVAACSQTASDGVSQNAESPNAGASAGAGTSPKPSAASSGGRSTGAKSSAADCTKATKVAIVDKAASAGADAFRPRKLTIQRGGFLAITNKSNRVDALVSTPDAGIVTSVLDRNERQVIQFPQAGTFTLKSAAAPGRAVLRVTVSGESGCDAPKPTLAITDGGAGKYSFAPRRLRLVATENFAVVNKSGVAQTVICTPDPGGNGDNSKLFKGETQLLAIDKPGRYVCTSIQHRDAKVTVTVKAGEDG